MPSPDLTVHVNHFAGATPQATPSITPQAQQAISPASATSTNTPPIPKVGPIDPNSDNPAESTYKQSLMNEPMHADYHPSKLRDVLSRVAGGFEGAFAGGDEGQKIHQSILNAPYNERHSDWLQNSQNKEKLATEEAAGTATSGKQALTAAQIAEQQSLAKLHGVESNTYHPTTQQQAIDVEQGKLKPDTREVKLTDGTIKHLIQRQGIFYDPETNAKVDRSAIEDISDEGKSLKDTKNARLPANLQASVSARKIIASGVGGKTEDGIAIDQPTFDAAKQYVQKLDDGQEPKGAYDDIVKTMEREQGKSLTSAQKIKLESTLHPPATGPVILGPASDSGSRPVIPLKPGVQVPAGSVTAPGESQINTPTAATRTRGEAAKTAIASGNDVINFVNQNKGKLGNVGNYWNNLMQNTPVADPTVEDFRGRVASWAAQQAAAHGFRASTVMHEFESRVGSTKNPDAIVSAIKGINDELNNAVNTAEGTKPIEEYVRDANGKLVLKK